MEKIVADSQRNRLGCNQGRRENSRGPGQNYISAPMMSLFLNNKTKNRWTVLQSVENTSKQGP